MKVNEAIVKGSLLELNGDLKSRIIVTGVFSGVPKGLFYEVDVGFHFDRHLVFQTRVFFKQIRTNQSFCKMLY